MLNNAEVLCTCVKDCEYRNESLFSVPKNSKNEWEIALNMNLNHNSKISATHFDPDYIIAIWESGVGASKYFVSTRQQTKIHLLLNHSFLLIFFNYF